MILQLPNEPKSTHDLVEAFCKKRNISYTQMITDDSLPSIAARNSLICELAKEGLSLKRIHTIAGCSQDYAQRVLDQRWKDETRVKTMRWEAFA